MQEGVWDLLIFFFFFGLLLSVYMTPSLFLVMVIVQ